MRVLLLEDNYGLADSFMLAESTMMTFNAKQLTLSLIQTNNTPKHFTC